MHQGSSQFAIKEDYIYSLLKAPGFGAAQSDSIFLARHSGLYRSLDGGLSWKDLLNDFGWAERLPATCVAQSPNFQKDGMVIAGIPGGVIISKSGAENWKTIFLQSPPSTVSALAFSPNFSKDKTVLAGTLEDGVFISKNGGEQWVAWNFGLLDLRILCLGLSPAFSSDETVFVGTESGLFYSWNQGKSWQELEMPFDFDAILSLAISPDYPSSGKIMVGTESNGLWLMQHPGQKWQQLGKHEITDSVNAVYYMNNDERLCITLDGIWCSTDQGASWINRLPKSFQDQQLAAILPPENCASGVTTLAGFSDGSLRALTMD